MKTYEVRDNSQQHCFETNQNELLTGCGDNDYVTQTVEIIVPPFDYTYEFAGNSYTKQFIIGKCEKGHHHLIMYY